MTSKRSTYTAFLALSVVAVSFGGLLATRRPELFGPYFGDIPPLVAISVVCLSGWAALYVLHVGRDFLVSRPCRRRRGLAVATGLAVPFMIVVTAADLLIGFPQRINVPPPGSLLFYPAMAYVVELSLHALPLALLLPLTDTIFRSWPVERRIWLCITLVACLEAGLQAANAADRALGSFVAVHVFAFGLVELALFRRYDFIAMYTFRIVYYAYWHGAWGELRLHWLL